MEASPRPWKLEAGYIFDANGVVVLDSVDANMKDEDAELIVVCVNNSASIAAINLSPESVTKASELVDNSLSGCKLTVNNHASDK